MLFLPSLEGSHVLAFLLFAHDFLPGKSQCSSSLNLFLDALDVINFLVLDLEQFYFALVGR